MYRVKAQIVEYEQGPYTETLTAALKQVYISQNIHWSLLSQSRFWRPGGCKN